MDFLSLQANLRPTAEAVRDLASGRSWNYREWHQTVAKLLSWLDQQGLRPGDRLACIAKNSAQFIALHLACARGGIIFVPLNWRLSKEELSQQLAGCQASFIVGDAYAQGLGEETFAIDELFTVAQAFPASNLSGEYNHSPTLILYTSGTTGLPKGIMHSENSLMESAINMMLLGQVNQHSRFLCEAPMFHIIGLVSCIRPVLFSGGTLFISDRFEPTRTLSLLSDAQLGVTHYFCVPQMANLLRQESSFDPAKLQGLQAILTGGAPHPPAQIRRWLSDGIAVVDGYGSSEAGTVFGMPFDLSLIDQHAGCVGLPTHRIQARLMNAEGEVAEDNESGEVQLKGANLFMGIWQNETAFANCFTEDGWFRTGDIALRNSKGFYRIVDRLKDMLISGGENIYPAEVEAVAVACEQVLECALVGVPDAKWGEVGCMFVVHTQESANIFDKARLLDTMQASLAKYKLPKQIHVVSSLPRTASGKVKKNLLKQQAETVQ